VLDRVERFSVSLTTGDGAHRSFRTDGDGPKVEDPRSSCSPIAIFCGGVYSAHRTFHNVTRFLVTLK